MRSRLVASVVVAAVAVFLLGGVCSRKLYPPKFLSIPDSVYAGDTARVRVVATGSGYDSVRYVVNWDDGTTDTTVPVALSEATTAWHVWTAAPNARYVRAAVFPIEDSRIITWAEQKRVFVEVGGQHAPVIDTVEGPPGVVMKGVEVDFEVRAHDPDGDSIRIHIDWGDGKDTTSELLGSPYYSGFYPMHTFAQVETAKVVITAQDRKGATSLPDTISVRVDTTGGVIWSEVSSSTSPAVVNDGVENCIYFMPLGLFQGQPGETPFLAITEDDSVKYYALGGSSPYAGAAFCAATQHIVGWGGSLLALDRQLRLAWRLETPDSSGYSDWSNPAVSRDRIYLGDKDSLFCFIDSVDHGVRAAALATQGAIVGAPVIDAYDAVYFGTDSGFLYKVGPGLDTIWRSRLTSAGEVYSPIIGAGGTIYCASSSQHVCAVDPATGIPAWTVTLDGGPSQIALGQTAIFVGSGFGRAYSLNPATGGINWVKTLDPGISGLPVSAAPVVAADRCVYFQNDDDVLYRLNQSDGSTAWECDCYSYLSGYGGETYPGKRAFLAGHPTNPTVLPNGNVIVAGKYALYCVAGARNGPLDQLAPWPKWQRDLYNTGSASGGK